MRNAKIVWSWTKTRETRFIVGWYWGRPFGRPRNIFMQVLRRRESTIPTSGVYLTPGSISVAIDRLLKRGLVNRVESTEDRRVRIVSLTPKGKELIAPIFRKHAAEIRKVFADASPKELRALETTLKKIGKRSERLGTGMKPSS